MKMAAEDIITHLRTNKSQDLCCDLLLTDRETDRFSYYFNSFVTVRIDLYDHDGVFKHGPSSNSSYAPVFIMRRNP
jgi:hypothetical protein